MSASKQASMLTAQVIRDGLSYFLRGGMRIKNGHLPLQNHHVPDNFYGICVASSPEPTMDAYVIAQVKALGIKQVRLDFTYGDLSNFNARFLRALISRNLQVTLHIVQPFSNAKNMHNAAEQAVWREFLQAVLDAFGDQLAQIEIGTTINRRRWAGYTYEGFLSAWAIAHKEIKARNIVLVGPNVQDFEPFYNVSLLKTFQQKNLLPDIHSNNLFAERSIEPERFDHRVFKYRWATVFKFNLIKKARILQKIGQDYSAPKLVSSVAFWAIFRIRRQLPDTEQKQADYAARYFALLAASGSLKQANWGALICEREGLIHNGLVDADYPALEQVAYYAQANGTLKNYRHYLSFNSVKTVVQMIQSAQYQQPISTATGLEIHAFQHADKTVHVAWTINGKIAFLNDIYDAKSLANASIYHRDGAALEAAQTHITESPIYLCWPENFAPQTITQPTLAKDLAIHAHVQGKQYFRFLQNGWDGLILANNQAEADLIAETLHPDTLLQPNRDGALRHARNAIWAVPDPRNINAQVTIKQPVKMYPHKAFLDKFKPSKAKRSWNGAMELMRRDIDTAAPVAYFEKVGDTTLKQNFYICEFITAETTVGQLFSAFARGETEWNGMTTENILKQVAQFCLTMHQRLVWFRDLSGGNILVRAGTNTGADSQLQFSLIDTARMRCVKHTPFPRQYKLADMARACHKLDWAHRQFLMAHYFAGIGSSFTWRDKLSFYLYDFKVSLKRTIGRKGIKRLIKRLKGQN
jgi:Lipopolysaccharide kinase (Kdo/WaaP) family